MESLEDVINYHLKCRHSFEVIYDHILGVPYLLEQVIQASPAVRIALRKAIEHQIEEVMLVPLDPSSA